MSRSSASGGDESSRSASSSLLYYLTEAQDWTVDQSEQAIRYPVWPNLPRPRSNLGQWWSTTARRFRGGSGEASGGGGDSLLLTHPRLAWQLVLSPAPARSHLLLARESQLELRTTSKKDPFYETLVLCLKLDPDPSPQSRKIVWSTGGGHFAVGSSAGRVSVYDIRGALVGLLEPPASEDWADQPLCAIFLESSTITGGDSLSGGTSSPLTLFTLHATGLMRVSAVRASSSSPHLLASVSVSDRLPGGTPLLSAVYSATAGVLAVGTLVPQHPQPGHSVAFKHGILYWRRLNQEPYLKTTVTTEDDLASQAQRPWSALFFPTSHPTTADGVVQLSLAPDNRRMLALHRRGGLSLWTFPAGQLLWSVSAGQDPFQALSSPLLAERQLTVGPSSARVLPKQPTSEIRAVEWWGNEDLIILRENGCLSVVAALDRASRTADAPEWFEPFASVAAGSEDTFFILECESRRKRKRTESASRGAVEEEDTELEDQESWRGWARHWARRLFAIDNDEPLRKKIRLVEQNYRLVAFKATTPEELFQRKIQDEEYGEALRLALKYGLDTDVVYQKQWHKSRMTRAAIEDFLTKISKRNWILHECLERVPDDMDSLRSLLEFGLEVTDVDALLTASSEEGLVRTTPARWLSAVSHKAAGAHLNQDEERELMIQCEREYRETVLGRVDRSALSLMQIELLRIRTRLLGLLDRLEAFELILGGRHRAPDRFKAEDFRKFRAISPLTAAVNYARDGQYDAVEVLFARYAHRLNRHRLAILWNIPETENPRGYAQLLPELVDRVVDAAEVIPLTSQRDRAPDWCETGEWCQTIESDEESVQELYLAEPMCQEFASDRLTQAQLSEWFELRARQIDRQSRQTEYSLNLIMLGMERGVEGLETLYHDLLQLDMLVYDCRIKVALTLEAYLQMPDLDKVKLMMTNTSEEMFIKHLSNWLLPFLTSVDKKQKGQGEDLLRHYLLYISDKSLVYLDQIMGHRAAKSLTHAWIRSDASMAALCVEVLNNCQLVDQLSVTERILRAVPRGNKVDPPIETHLVFLDRAINTLKTLEKYGVHKSLSFIRANREDPETVSRLMVSAVHREFKQTPNMTKAKIRSMLTELQSTISEVLTSIHPKMLNKIVIEGLLLSSDETKIILAREFMDLDGKVRPMNTTGAVDTGILLTFQESVDCIVKVAREYFNSAVNSQDIAIKLSKDCLQLVRTKKSDVIEAELRLISGLEFLEQAHVSILPAELRTNRDRSALLASALEHNKSMYRNIDAVLEAGISLQIADNEVTCKGEALRLIVQAALSAKDLKTAVTAARSLVRRGHHRGWAECARVGQHPDCAKNEERTQLLHFAVAHCPDDQIPEVLSQSLTEDANVLLAQQDKSSTALPGVLAKSAKSLLSDVSGLLLTGSVKQSSVASQLKPPVGLMQPVFYIDTAIQEDLLPLYKVHANVSRSHDLLRIIQLGIPMEVDENHLIPQLASESFKSDSLLNIAYLVHLDNLETFNQVLETFPASSFNHAMALTASSLRVILKTKGKISDSVITKPDLLVENARSCLKELNSEEEANAFEKRVTLFEDFVQAKRLKEISNSVDLSRFISDVSYKEETILGLCMTENSEQFQFASTLVRRYRLDEWEACMTFLEYLVCESSLSIQEIEANVKNLPVLRRVRSDSARFLLRMTQIYGELDGCNYNKLIFFFGLFDAADVEVAGMAVSAHLATLRKLKSSAPSLEYKQLVSRDTSISSNARLQLIVPHLSEGNVHVFAKLAGNFLLRSSMVFQAWARHLFWHGDKPHAATPTTGEQWVHRYHSCAAYLARLSAEDVVALMEGCVFGEGSAKITTEGRLEILRRCLKFCRQQRDGQTKHQKGDSISDAAAWTAAETRLKELSEHLELVLTSALTKLSALGVGQEVIDAAACRLPGPGYYTDLLAEMLILGLSLSEAMDYAISVGHREALDSGFCHALVQIAKRGEETRLAECLHEAGGVLEDSCIVSTLTSLLEDDSIRVQLGKFLINQLSKWLEPEKVRGLILSHAYRVLSTWRLTADIPPLDQLTEDPAGSLQALIDGEVAEHLANLGDVILTISLVFPATVSTELWRAWTRVCLLRGEVNLVLSRAGPKVSQEFAGVAFSVLATSSPASAISLAVGCLEAASPVEQTTRWIPEIIALATSSSDSFEPAEIDSRVLHMLIERRLLPKLVGGPLYSRVIGCLLEEFDSDWLEKSARDLNTAGFVLEAGYIVAEMQSLHPGFRTLDVLSGLLSKLFKS